MDYKSITKKKGFLYRGISNNDYIVSKHRGYFWSVSRDVIGLYFSDDPYTAECYSEKLTLKGKTSTPNRPNYIVVYSKRDLPKLLTGKNMKSFVEFCKKVDTIQKKDDIHYQMIFKRYVSGDDHLFIGKLSFGKAKEIYEYRPMLNSWLRIK